MSFISPLKEEFAIAPIQDRHSVVLKLAAANTEDAKYYQGLLILQKIYDEVMKHDEPTNVRVATSAESALLNEMQNHLKKISVHDKRYTELNTRLNLLIYPFETIRTIEFIKDGLCLDLVTQKHEQQQVKNDDILEKITESVLDKNLIDGRKLLNDIFEDFKTSGDVDVDLLAFPTIKTLMVEQNSMTADAEVSLLKKIFMHPTEKLFGNDILDRLIRLWKLQKSDTHQEFNGWQLESLPFYNFTLTQLDYLIEHASSIVLSEECFVQAYLEKLVPAQYYNRYSNGEFISFWDDNENILQEYLSCLENFTLKLPNVYFRLKSAVKFYLLRVDIVRQDFKETSLVQFLNGTSNQAIAASPTPSRILDLFSFNKNIEDVSSNTKDTQVLIDLPLLKYGQISEQDKLLVIEEYLAGLIAQDKLKVSIESLGSHMDYHNVLKPLYLKLMLTVCSNIQESWANALGSEKYEQLTAESFVTFSPSTLNESVKRKPKDTIKLAVKTKNVKRLSIRVFQVNMENYFCSHKNSNEMTIADNKDQIDLDGLCPTWEKDIDLSSEPAIHVKTNNFAFGEEDLAPSVFKGRGLWVIEFVGGQNQCRAIIQKGYLRHIVQKSTAGHIVRVLDESNLPVWNSKIWCSNQYYQADKSGNILIPYLPSNESSRTIDILLISTSDEFCEPTSFYQEVEEYKIEADFYVNPEMISFNKKATVIVTPRLTINGVSVPLSLLENTMLHVACTNVDDVKNNFTCQKLDQISSSIYFEYMVPDRLMTLEFTLQANVRSLNNSLQATEAKHSIFYRTAVKNSGVPSSVHLRKANDGNYHIHAFGKNGEPKKDYEISIRLKHAFTQYRTVEATLKTNNEGSVELGDLVDIQWIEYFNAQGAYKQWIINSEERGLLPPTICAPAGTSFKVTCYSSLSSDLLYSLYKTGAREMLIENMSHLLQKCNDYIAVSALPEGEYMLYLASNSEGEKRIKCTVIDNQIDLSSIPASTEKSTGKDQFWHNWVIGKNNYAKQNGVELQQALRISNVYTDNNDTVFIKLKNWSSKAFVVVTTSTFVPTSSESLKRLIENRSLSRPLVQENMVTSKSVFLNDKQIGEEYQYILNRARSEKWVGSNLTKPSLLIHPKKNASTKSKSRLLKTETLTGGSLAGFGTGMQKRAVGFNSLLRCGANRSMFEPTESSLSFLNHTSPIVILSVPDNGIITIDRNNLGFGGNLLQTVAFSGEQAVFRAIVLPPVNNSPLFQYNDLRQKQSSNKTLIRSKVVKYVEPGEKITIRTNEYETIDNFKKLFDTIKNISEVGGTLDQEFGYLKTWIGLDLERKLRLYEENVCHELNFWLKRKDPKFFMEFVIPAIKSKVQKKFMDIYLTDGDLSEFSSNIYKYGQLSTVEKALLATTQSTEFLTIVLRSFKEAFDEKIVDDHSDKIFDSILSGSLLNVSGGSINVYEPEYDAIEACSVTPMPISYSLSSPAYSRALPSPPLFGSSANPKVKSSSIALLSKKAEEEVFENQTTSKVENDDDGYEEAANLLREKAKKCQRKIVYRYTEKTSEWVEKGYYNEQDTVFVKKFWIDYLEFHLNCRGGQQKSFLSENFVYCISNITEILYVLSLTDLPLQSEPNCVTEITTTGTDYSDKNTIQLSIRASPNYPLMVFYRTLTESALLFSSVIDNNKNNLMLAQELFVFDKKTPIDSEECIKINPLSSSLNPNVEYGIHLIISNVSGKSLTCQVTVQIPTGAVPCKKTSYCKSKTISINAYSTWHEVTGTFYFPSEGQFNIVPVTVSSLSGDKLLGKIESIDINVSEKTSTDGTTFDYDSSNQLLSLSSWSVIASKGSNSSVISFLENYKRLERIDFNPIGWRMKETSFARQVFDVLAHQRYFFSAQLWKYGVYHQFDDIIRDLLNFSKSSLLDNVGQTFDSPLVSKRPEDHIQIFDYFPLHNARTHPLKSTHEILNSQFYKQYNDFLSYMSQQTSQPSNTDLVILTLYLILQDRIGDAQSTFARIKCGKNDADCQVQIDYLNAYLKTRIPVTDHTEQQTQDLNSVKEIVSKYRNFGVLKLRKMFAELYEFVCEVEQGDFNFKEDFSEQNTKRIQAEPILDFEIDQRLQELVVQYGNIKCIDIKYYEMNIEIMFSSNPFMNDRKTPALSNKKFTWIKPSFSSRVDLPEKIVASSETDADGDYNMIGVGQVKSAQILHIPFSGTNKNLFVEISDAGSQTSIKKSQAYFSHNLNVHIAEYFGIARVLSGKTKRPLAGAYVKVYARMKQNQAVHFWKDGYTGLNGVFDYISVTEGNALMGGEETDLKTLMNDKVDKLSILIMSSDEGSVVKEAYPPLT